MQFRVDAVVEHRCGTSQQMRVNDNTVDSVSYKCLWNNSWTPEPVSAQCNFTTCPPAPYPTPESNLETDYKEGDPVDFGDSVTYTCRQGFYFEDDSDLSMYRVAIQ